MRVVSFAILMLLCLTVAAAPVFYLSEGPNPNGDKAFRLAVVGLNFIEEDFDSFGHGFTLDGITLGGVRVDFTLPDLGASSAEIFRSDAFGLEGGQYGTVYQGSLLNENRPQGFIGPSDTFTFTFSGDVVKGFGIWVFDDAWDSADYFQLIVNDLGGNTWKSGVLDANPEIAAHIVEGFIGVTLDTGIRSVTIKRSGTILTSFELDHLQLASIKAVFAPPPRVALLVKTYTVRIGDNLSKIAQKFYGITSPWRKIYQANTALIGSNPNMIKPGQKLTVPKAGLQQRSRREARTRK